MKNKTLGAAVLGAALLAVPLKAQAQPDAAAAPAPAPPSTAPSAPPLAVAAPSEPASCGPKGLARVAEVARDGLVRVTTHTSTGAGFLIDANHVVTHYGVVERPLSLRVTGSDGLTIGAQVVAVDAFERIAILKLDEPLPSKPIDLAASMPEIGREVVGIGTTSDFGAPGGKPAGLPAHLRGVVTDRRDDLVATDALFTYSHFGGPLLDCEGRAVGVIVPPIPRFGALDSLAGRAISALKIRETLGKEGRGPRPRGPWVVLGFETALAAQFEPGRGFIGGTFGLPLLFAEHWDFVPRFGVFAHLPPATGVDIPIARTSTLRLTPDLRLGYRIPLAPAPVSISLVPSIGAGWNLENTRKEDYKITLDDPACANTAACSFHVTKSEQSSWRTEGALFVGLTAHISALSLSYELRVVPQTDVKFIHQIALGAATF